MKPKVKPEETAELERRVSSLEGEVRALASLVSMLQDMVSCRRVSPPPFVIESPFAPKTEAERILGPRIT